MASGAGARRLVAVRDPTDSPSGGALEIEGEEVGQEVVGGDVGRPAVGIEDGAVQAGVDVARLGGALVVEVGQGARLQLRLAGTVRVQPATTQLVQPPGRVNRAARQRSLVRPPGADGAGRWAAPTDPVRGAPEASSSQTPALG